MKIKVKELSYDRLMSIKAGEHKMPVRQWYILRKLMSGLAKGELKAVDFRYEEKGMDRLGKKETALFLMNHSSFTDLQIIGHLLADRPYHIVCTNDGMIAKEGLMRALGCIPTKKFITDVNLIRDMKYALNKLNSSIVMYPEASYSFDGSETPLPDSLGKCLKLLDVPVIMIKTEGAFLRDPLYNCLQKRNARVSAKVEYLLSREDIKEKSAEELNAILKKEFVYDHFRSQCKKGVIIDEDFRADGLHRVLYKCPECKTEGQMKGQGTEISCGNCGDVYTLDKKGRLIGNKHRAAFEYATDWYRWQREEVRQEVEAGQYNMELDVDIMVLADSKCIYKVGSGRLIHNDEGFHLTGCDGRLDFRMPSKRSYSLYADYYWYEIGDMICIGDTRYQYYCFPKDQEKAIVAKARLATEELYKLKNKK